MASYDTSICCQMYHYLFGLLNSPIMRATVLREINERPRSPALESQFMQYEASEAEEPFQRL